MSEYFPGGNPFESRKDDSPESTPSKKKSKEVKTGPAEREGSAQKPEKQSSLLDKLLAGKPAVKPETEEKTAERPPDTPEAAGAAPEMTADEAAEVLTRMAEARELEIGATELHGAEAGAAETTEAEAAVELLEQVKAAAKEQGHGSAAGLLAAAEARVLSVLGLAEEADEASAPATGELIIDPNAVNEAVLPLREPAAPEAGPAARPQYAREHTAEYIYHESDAAGAALLGGIIGYLVGRRRGRIKTEKKLLPVQRKLEHEVRVAHVQLLDSELRVRRLAAEKAQFAGNKERLQKGTAPPERLQPGVRESRPQLNKPDRAEHVGKVLMRAEAVRGGRPEVAAGLHGVEPERVRTMSLRELLPVADKILVEGSSLRKIYESRLLGERGLRRLVAEYLRGKDIRKQLRREIIEHEIDFERDPLLRDKAYREVLGRNESQSLQQLLRKAGVTEHEPDGHAAKRQEHYEAALARAERHRRAADTAMITVIVVLSIAVVLLIIGR
jgi:hypothetical protein